MTPVVTSLIRNARARVGKRAVERGKVVILPENRKSSRKISSVISECTENSEINHYKFPNLSDFKLTLFVIKTRIHFFFLILKYLSHRIYICYRYHRIAE